MKICQGSTQPSAIVKVIHDEKYENAKVNMLFIDGAIYILTNDGLQLFNDGFIMSEELKGYSDNYINLLKLIRENYKPIARAINLVQQGGKKFLNVNFVDGLMVC